MLTRLRSLLEVCFNMKTTFKVTDLFAGYWTEFPKPTPYSELSEEEQEQKFMDVLTNGLPNYRTMILNPSYHHYSNRLGPIPMVAVSTVPKIPKNKKWYDTFRQGYSNV